MEIITKEYSLSSRESEDQKIEYPPTCFLLEYWHITLTVAILGAGLLFPFAIFVTNDATFKISKINLNEVGDYIAGVAAPVAFLWLVKGFYQQSEQLKINNLSLAAQLQELNNSVEAQNSQAESMREQLRILTRDKYFPSFKLIEFKPFYDTVTMTVKNNGNTVYGANAHILTDGMIVESQTLLPNNSGLDITVQSVAVLETNNTFAFDLKIDFRIETGVVESLCYRVTSRPLLISSADCPADFIIIPCTEDK